MISACAARLFSLLSGTRLQILLASQFTAQDCKAWGRAVIALSSDHPIHSSVSPILQRTIEEPDSAASQMRWNAVVSATLSFTAGVEYFIQDIIRLCLIRNSGLRKKGFKDCQISGLELEQIENLEELKLKQISTIADKKTKGALFTEKHKRAHSFLDLSIEIDTTLAASLDSLWAMRNRLAHENHSSVREFRISTISGDIRITQDVDPASYVSFAMDYCELLTEGANYLRSFDEAALTKWTANDSLFANKKS